MQVTWPPTFLSLWSSDPQHDRTATTKGLLRACQHGRVEEARQLLHSLLHPTSGDEQDEVGASAAH